jgi:hypothetical protein
MIGHELAIEQLKPTRFHPRHQPCECDFGGIGRSAEHTFAKKGAAHCKTVQPAYQFVTLPAFHAMRMACRVQREECLFNIGVDPCLCPVHRRLRTCLDDLRKGSVRRYPKPPLPDYLGQRPGKVKSIQRQNRTPLRLHPIGMRIIARIGHWKHAMRIGAQQEVHVYRQCSGFPAAGITQQVMLKTIRPAVPPIISHSHHG